MERLFCFRPFCICFSAATLLDSEAIFGLFYQNPPETNFPAISTWLQLPFVAHTVFCLWALDNR